MQSAAPFTFAPPVSLADGRDAVVRVLTSDLSCTGTLIDRDLVLTAHHCLADIHQEPESVPPMDRPAPEGRPETRVAKSPRFQPRAPRTQRTMPTVGAADVHIELGGDYLPWGTVGVKAIVAPPCGLDGGPGDIAVLVLQHPLKGLPIWRPRLDAPPKVGEVLDPVGFGKCALSPEGITRRIRMGGPVESVDANVIRMTASICPGDSGGPVIVRGSEEVVGIVSMSAMDADAKTRNASIMVRIDTFRRVIAHARWVADGTPKNELPPLACEE